METLVFKKVEEAVERADFDCGVKSINDCIRDSYYPTIMQHAYAYSVSGEKRVLGYYMILFREIELEKFPEEISDYDSGILDSKIAAVHIKYIAVDKKYQRNKVGTEILRTIIKTVRELADSWPVRVITIDAVNHLVGWYEKAGFQKMPVNTPGQAGITEAMFFDCLRFPEKLSEYIR